MKRLTFFIVILSMLSISVFGQNDVFTKVQDMPTFSTCDNDEDKDWKCTEAAIKTFIQKNIEYPKYALKNGVEGTCVVQFIVEKDGSITNFKIIRNVGAGLGEEALRVVEQFPDFHPGKARGETVRVYMNIPVRFSLDEWKKIKKARKKAEKNKPKD